MLAGVKNNIIIIIILIITIIIIIKIIILVIKIIIITFHAPATSVQLKNGHGMLLASAAIGLQCGTMEARLLALKAAHSSDWLFALPISFCGLRMCDETV